MSFALFQKDDSLLGVAFVGMTPLFCCQARVLFIDVPYTLATEEAERIGVDHVARMSSAGNSEVSAG